MVVRRERQAQRARRRRTLPGTGPQDPDVEVGAFDRNGVHRLTAGGMEVAGDELQDLRHLAAVVHQCFRRFTDAEQALLLLDPGRESLGAAQRPGLGRDQQTIDHLRLGCRAVGAGGEAAHQLPAAHQSGTTQPEIDAARVQLGDRGELLGNHQRGMVSQQHRAGPHPDLAGRTRDQRDQHRRRR